MFVVYWGCSVITSQVVPSCLSWFNVHLNSGERICLSAIKLFGAYWFYTVYLTVIMYNVYCRTVSLCTRVTMRVYNWPQLTLSGWLPTIDLTVNVQCSQLTQLSMFNVHNWLNCQCSMFEWLLAYYWLNCQCSTTLCSLSLLTVDPTSVRQFGKLTYKCSLWTPYSW